MTNGLDKLAKFWPIVLFIGIVIGAAAEVRMAVADNEEDIKVIEEQQQQIRKAIEEQTAANARIDERTLNIQHQLNVIIDRLRDKER